MVRPNARVEFGEGSAPCHCVCSADMVAWLLHRYRPHSRHIQGETN